MPFFFKNLELCLINESIFSTCSTISMLRITSNFFKLLKLKQIRFILELLGPHRFRNVREAISCNFVLLSSNMHLVAPRKNEKTVLKNSLVDNFGQSYLWATDRRTCFQRHKQEKQDELKYQFCEVEFSNFDRPDAENAQF